MQQTALLLLLDNWILPVAFSTASGFHVCALMGYGDFRFSLI
jgi:hypothetical protein